MIIIEGISILPGGGLGADIQFNLGSEIVQHTLTITETVDMRRAEKDPCAAVEKEVARLVQNAGMDLCDDGDDPGP